jgi:hypothetical protein
MTDIVARARKTLRDRLGDDLHIKPNEIPLDIPVVDIGVEVATIIQVHRHILHPAAPLGRALFGVNAASGSRPLPVCLC